MATQPKMSAQVVLSVVFGALCVATVAYAALRERPFVDDRQYVLIRVLAALGAGGIAAILPGFFNVELRPGSALAIRGGGALGIFAIVFLADPPGLVAPASSEPNAVKACDVNDTRSCRCPPNRVGTQTCSTEGQWGTCVCQELVCEPGASRECPCVGEQRGVQACDRDGMWRDCTCERFESSVAGPLGELGRPGGTSAIGPPLPGLWTNGIVTVSFVVEGSHVRLVDASGLGVRGEGTLEGRNLTLHITTTYLGSGTAELVWDGANMLSGTVTSAEGTVPSMFVRFL